MSRRAQHVGEQVVVPEPLPLVVQGDQEQVGALQGHEHAAAVVRADDGVTQWAGEPVEDRRSQQELPHRLGLVRQHLLDEVVDEIPVSPGELGDEAADVLAPTDRQRRELQRGDPPLGAFLEGLDVLGRQAYPDVPGEVLGRLVEGEPQVGGADLDQLPAHPPSSQRQVRVGAGAQHDMDVGGQVREQEGDPLADLGVVHQVEVVQDQPHLTRCCGQLVEQGREHELGRDRAEMSSSAPAPTVGTAARSADTTYVQNDAGSLSEASRDSHATPRSAPSAW